MEAHFPFVCAKKNAGRKKVRQGHAVPLKEVVFTLQLDAVSTSEDLVSFSGFLA